jgi:ABC-type ATPase with predicted acetyltransferase domain
VVDAVAPARPMAEAMGLLTAAGLGEPMLWMRRFAQLSEGEQFRARLARAISLQPREGGCPPLLCDEFGSLLHRRLARAVAFNLRKQVSREQLCMVVATSDPDLTDALRQGNRI